MATETRYEHIVLDDETGPMIAGTNMKVIGLVLAHQAYGWSPEELAFQFPTLTLGQIHSALAYYWDHREALDQEIERQVEYVEEARRSQPPPPLLERLRAKGLI